MSQHTPGPWTLAPCSHGGAILKRGADTHPQSHLQVVPVADASLMVAAPDLLDSCKELVDALSAAMRVMASNGLGEQFFAGIRAAGVMEGIGVRAKDAIAKAQGQ